MYDLGCMLMVNQDLSWYSTDYRVYIDSSMIVRPLAGCHCTYALINWMVLLLEYDGSDEYENLVAFLAPVTRVSQNRPIYKSTSTMAARKRSHCHT